MKDAQTRQQQNGDNVEEQGGTQHAAVERDLARLRAERSQVSAMLAEAHDVLATCHVPSLWPARHAPHTSAEGTDPVEALREQHALAELVQVLASTLDYEGTLSQLVELIAEDVGDIAVLYVCSSDGIARRVRVANCDASTREYSRQIRDIRGEASPSHPVSLAMSTKQPLLAEVTPAVLGSLAHSPEHAAALSALHLRSVMAVPLLIADRCVGALLLKSVTRVYEARDLRFAQEVAQRSALLIENARLHQTAEQAIRARDEMLGVVAHDLRNPLTAILLEVSMLAIACRDAPPNVRDSAAAIQDAAKFMKRLTEDLLDAERIRLGRLSVNRRRVPVAPTISEFVRTQKSIVEEAHLDLRLDIADGVSDVDVDHDRLLQVLENLLGNAERFTPPGGRMTIGAKQGGADVLFWVADTGSGIDATELPRLFDRSAAATSRSDRRGTGLGLPIVKGIVEAHGGRVWAESKVGEGTTFFFTLPAAISPAA